MKSAILSYFENLRRGSWSLNKRSVTVPKTPELLENIRCHQTDEYPVISTEDDSPVPPLACTFSQVKSNEHILSLVDENGSVTLYDTNIAGDNALLTEWSAHNNAIFDVKWMGGENKLLTASGDQTVCLWDVKTKAKLLTFKGHTSSVRSVGFRPFDDAVFSSGSRDGHIRLWDVRCNVKDEKASSVNVIRNAHTVTQANPPKKKRTRPGQQIQDSQQSVTCVLFQDDHLLATAGAVDGCVKVWDLRKIKPDTCVAVNSFPYSGPSKRAHGYSSLVFDSYHSRLFANCTDDVIYCYDFNTYNPEPVKTFRGHRNTSFYVKAVLSPDNQYLLSGSSDEHACIWQVDEPNASPVILKGHRSEISDVAWCKTDTFRIVTTSDDYTMRVWRFDPTAKIRRERGHTDQMYNITGTAECTHRDIGISTPMTPTISPHSSLKRAVSAPVGGPLQLTPKRPKLSVASTPSPSIKAWLKRSASDSQASSSTEDVSKKPKLAQLPEDRKPSVKRSASEMDSEENVVTDSLNAEKRLKLDNGDSNCDSKRREIKPVCKRVLIKNEEKEETKIKPLENKAQCPNKENGVHGVLNGIKAEIHRSSPKKIGRVLKNTDTNSSPEKRNDVAQEFYSPIRTRIFDKDSGQNVQSPTANLPNLVVDGPICSPKQVLSKNRNNKGKVDWLTEMRIHKLSQTSARNSPSNKQCSRSLLDKLTSSVKGETTPDKQKQEQPEQSSKSKTVSPVRGTKSITSFFSRPQNV